MVRAILAGTKTQTRRVVKWRDVSPGLNLGFSGLSATRWPTEDAPAWVLTSPGVGGAWQERSAPTRCPHGSPGGRLWVRETWAPCPDDRDGRHFIYRADDVRRYDGEAWKWRPSIHMPRAASRITLELTDVRVQRLQDISAADSISEGIGFEARLRGYCLPDGSHFHATDPRVSYWSLWDAINGSGSVEQNPWVWVITFKRV